LQEGGSRTALPRVGSHEQIGQDEGSGHCTGRKSRIELCKSNRGAALVLQVVGQKDNRFVPLDPIPQELPGAVEIAFESIETP
jgi:hypothetical protein